MIDLVKEDPDCEDKPEWYKTEEELYAFACTLKELDEALQMLAKMLVNDEEAMFIITRCLAEIEKHVVYPKKDALS